MGTRSQNLIIIIMPLEPKAQGLDSSICLCRLQLCEIIPVNFRF